MQLIMWDQSVLVFGASDSKSSPESCFPGQTHRICEGVPGAVPRPAARAEGGPSVVQGCRAGLVCSTGVLAREGHPPWAGRCFGCGCVTLPCISLCWDLQGHTGSLRAVLLLELLHIVHKQ